MADPRTAIIDERLKQIRNIIAVSSGKGGVGKSLVASVLALTLARKGCKVGLFDLDFTSPSSHIILGLGDLQPEEKNGIIPPEIYGFRYMSIVYYSGERPSPLRGSAVSNALIELLAVTLWNGLDYLIIDMPPGIGDATLDLLRLVKNVEFLVVTTPSKIAFGTVRKLIDLLSGLAVPVIGVLENMTMTDSKFIQQRVEERGLRFWGEVPFDANLEETIGKVKALLKTKFSERLSELVEKNL
ncbi:MAG: Mrp/NBP35 family ATP-binding protein [Candidatus Bathyarchaeota archaeon]|nr:Mrp/NBP35 family ATP-binding protein [Candidatus Bathyarchaeota archaeon]